MFCLVYDLIRLQMKCVNSVNCFTIFIFEGQNMSLDNGVLLKSTFNDKSLLMLFMISNSLSTSYFLMNVFFKTFICSAMI